MHQPSLASRVAVRTVAVLCCVGLLVPVFPGAAVAAPASLCQVSDARLGEISGLVATPDGYAVINDGGTSVQVFLLDRNCGVTKVLSNAQDPLDPEDLARTADGTFWVADIGDNDRKRQSVVVWAMSATGNTVIRHRLSYPDGAHDAEALLMSADKTPVIVTKSTTGAAKVYVAPQPFSAAAATQTLRAAGDLTISPSGTKGGPSEVGPAAQTLVTGGAVAPNGGKVAVRTYTDAYEWTVAQGASAAQIAKAITSQTPRRTPLPDEPQGESLAYTSDGSALLTLSEGADQPLQQWTPSGGGKKPAGGSGSSGGLLPELTLQNVMRGIYITAFLGLVFLAAGIWGIARFRKQRKANADLGEYDPSDTPDHGSAEAEPDIPDDPYGAPLLYPPVPANPGRRPPGRSTTYGEPGSGAASGPAPARPNRPQGAVYGSGKPAAGRSGTVYGGSGRNPGE